MTLDPGAIPFTLCSVRAAITASRVGSFRQTAERFGVKQSAISRQVRSLEDILGVSLFERGSTGVRPTLAGQVFLREADAALENLHRAARAARQAGEGRSGRLRIGLAMPPTNERLMALTLAFRHRHTAVRIEMTEGRPAELEALVASHQLDVALLPDGGVASGLDTMEFLRSPLSLVAPVDHRLSFPEDLDWSQLTGDTILVSERDIGPRTRHWLEAKLVAHGAVMLIEANVSLTLALVSLGEGVALCSSVSLESQEVMRDLVVRPVIEPPGITSSYDLIWSNRNDNPVLRRFLSAARTLSPGLISAAHQVSRWRGEDETSLGPRT